jgi:hypothetical protein
MSDSFLVAAGTSCDEDCALRCPDGKCGDPTLTCVTDQPGDRCYDCTSSAAFQDSCFGDQDAMIIAAEAKCGYDCDGRCPTHADSDCTGDEVCVVQDNGLFDQCVDCDPTSFEYYCPFWSEEIVRAAEVACDITCNGTDTKAGTRAPSVVKHPAVGV